MFEFSQFASSRDDTLQHSKEDKKDLSTLKNGEVKKKEIFVLPIAKF